MVRVSLDAGEESDCSSNGSVIRAPVCEDAGGESCVQEGDWRGGTPLSSPQASGPTREGGLSRQGSSVRFASDVSGNSPTHSVRRNLQAAAKYFAVKETANGAVANDTMANPGGTPSSNGPSLTASGDNPQVCM